MMMNVELGGTKVVMTTFKYQPSICMVGLRTTMKTVRTDGLWTLSWNANYYTDIFSIRYRRWHQKRV